MRRALVVLLLAAACTGGGHGRARPSGKSVDDCEEELKSARRMTTVLRLSDGEQQREFRAPDRPRSDGAFSRLDPALPPLRVKVTQTHPVKYRTDLTFHPAGLPSWSIAEAWPVTQVDVGVLIRTGSPRGLIMARATNGNVFWETGSFFGGYPLVVGVVGTDLVLARTHDTGAPPTLLRITAITAEQRWSTPLPRGDWFRVVGDRVLVLASADSRYGHGEIQVLDVRTGKPLWKKRLPLPKAMDAKITGDEIEVDSVTRAFGGCG